LNTPVEDHFFVVGIGTSAGGLKALRLFFENCPDDTGMAFVIVQHLSPNYKSLMPELLSKNTNMPIAEAQDNVLVEPNNVYLIPGNKNLLIQNNYLILENRPVQTMNFAIDIFFSSLATDKSHLAIGIILSGTGTDGTKGAKAIKERGGTIIAQSPRSSGFDGMPRSVISQDLPDLVLTPQDMASELIQYAKNPQFNYLISGTDLSHKMSSINKILKIIKEKNEIDFSGYKLQTILRRTAKRLNITKSKSIEDYIDTLYESPEEVTNLAQEYLIGVTSFFRDSAVFEYVNEHIIPEIVTKADQTENIIKIWIIACSSGEEVYTIAMLLDDYLIKKELNIKYKIYGTDVDDNAVYKASKGIYDLAEVKGIPETFLERYFERTGGTFKVKTNIRENIIFSKHNVVVNPPFSKMDLISCRNLLIYLDTEYKHHTLSTIKYALNPNGYLLLGKSETTGVFDKSFKNVSTKYRVYQNTGSVYYSSNNPKKTMNSISSMRLVLSKNI